MHNPVKISIANPCQVEWNTMRHEEGGAYCSKCSSHVVDFTKMTDAQVLETIAGMNGKRCGRFSVEQTNRPIIKKQPAKSQFRIKALLAGLAAFMGMKNAYAENSLGITPPAIRFEQFDTITRQPVDTSIISNADTSAKMVLIRGRVVETFNRAKHNRPRPVQNAQISTADSLSSTYTDKDGYFKMKVLYRGNTEINISSGSYEIGNKTIRLREFLVRKRPLLIKLEHQVIMGFM
jgi:hypothetical protein